MWQTRMGLYAADHQPSKRNRLEVAQRGWMTMYYVVFQPSVNRRPITYKPNTGVYNIPIDING